MGSMIGDRFGQGVAVMPNPPAKGNMFVDVCKLSHFTFANAPGRYGHFDVACMDKQFGGARFWDDTIQQGMVQIRDGKIFRTGTVYMSVGYSGTPEAKPAFEAGGLRWANQEDNKRSAPGTANQNKQWNYAAGDFKEGDAVHLRTRVCDSKSDSLDRCI